MDTYSPLNHAMMRNRQRLSRMALVAVLLLTALLAPTRFATAQKPSTKDTAIQQDLQEQAVQVKRFKEAVARMEPYVQQAKDGTLLLTVKAGAEIGVAPDLFNILIQSVSTVNEQIRAGQLRPEDVLLATPTTPQSPPQTSSCRGYNNVERYWWGVVAWIDSCGTEELIQQYRAWNWAGMVSGACQALPILVTKIGCWIVRVYVRFTVWRVESVYNNGGRRGVILSQPWAGPGYWVSQ
jgi:hypothetical protein